MRLVSIDIDPQNRSNRIHLGPFVAGLNAVWGARGAGKSTIAKFVRGLLYNRHRDSSGFGQEAVDGLVGSLQWADNSGTSRVISSADSSTDRDYTLEGPYHFGRQNSLHSDGSFPQSNPTEQPWHRIGGEVYDAVFCGRLGETLPERLWQAARELGIHVSTGNQQDETYRRLKAEQHRLEQRLHHLRVDDRDRAWWASERDRLVSRAEEIRLNPELHALPATGAVPSSATVASNAYFMNRPSSQANPTATPTTATYREWESQLIALRAELSELEASFADRARMIIEQRRNSDSDTTFTTDKSMPASNGRYTRSHKPEHDHYGTWVGYAKHRVAPKVTSSTLDDLHREQDAIVSRKSQVIAQIEDLQNRLLLDRSTLSFRATSAWELEEIQQRILYAEEVLKSWDLYETTRKRLAEVQLQLRGNGPYHDAMQGSFLQTVERYVRELSAGSLRRLPTWALEALRRDLGYAAGLSQHGRAESYREVYRDYRPDINRQDHAVPPSQSSERQLVELAIRMAICDSAAHRIGRLPLILDDALDGFHGATLDHLVRVLIEFAREGQQVLLMTSESEVAQRVRGHHGWVAQLNSPVENVSTSVIDTPRYVQPIRQLPIAPAAYTPVSFESGRYYEPSYTDINAQLAAVADSHASPSDGVWYEPSLGASSTQNVYQFSDYPRWRSSVSNQAPAYGPVQSFAQPLVQSFAQPIVRATQSNAAPQAAYFLTVRNPIEDAPGMVTRLTTQGHTLADGLHSIGIHSVGSFLNADPAAIASRLQAMRVSSSDISDRQAEQRLMCTVPNLRSFDARILVGCGIQNTADLSSIPPGRLLKTVEKFLTTPQGQEILRNGSSFEISRMTTWLASAGRSVSRHRVTPDARDQQLRNRDRTRTRTRTRDRIRARNAEANFVNPKATIYSPTTIASNSHLSSGKVTDRPVSSVNSTLLRFYLNLDSPVVDAPSIGPRIAERLNAIGIRTIQDLLRANPATVATQLDDKKTTAEIVLEWQQQSTLVCRVPNLRGHDAQQLVACGVTTAEQLASANVGSLVNKVATFASSKVGQRILRGSAGADEAEVRDWIQWASSSRTLRAA